MHKRFDEIKNKFLTSALQIYASKFLFVTNTIQTTQHVHVQQGYINALLTHVSSVVVVEMILSLVVYQLLLCQNM